MDRLAPGEIQTNTLTRIPTDFHCRCSKDRFKNALLAMGPVKLKEYFEIAEGERNLVCQYCSTVHTLNDADIQQLTEASQSH
jgi:redox-regulated HSP33 family molecular chaperone